MQIDVTKETESLSKKPKVITITVNERSVTFSKHKVTGLEIKQAAIKQCVAIQQDFVLFEVKCDSQLEQIGDCETITLHEGQRFRATAPDDNS
ncbi:hypothetical protein NIES2101_42280 [Calothrix sp. HK-06]|nr:hypothetical protein NIES2101_42280 [Calothrix sp. HK-06]